MLKKLQGVLSVIVLALIVLNIIIDTDKISGFISLFLGLTMLTIGLQELQKDKRVIGTVCITLFIFSIIVAIQNFMLVY